MPGYFFVLQNLTDDVFQFDVGPDGELTHPVAVLVGVGVFPEVVLQLFVRGMRFSQSASLT